MNKNNHTFRISKWSLATCVTAAALSFFPVLVTPMNRATCNSNFEPGVDSSWIEILYRTDSKRHELSQALEE